MTKKLRRVDVQVSILMIITAVLCSICVFAVCYEETHEDMVNSLKERVFAIYEYVDGYIDESTFTDINTKDDMDNKAYIDTKAMLRDIRKATNVMYLYTAKKDEKTGDFIYIIDGLDRDDKDFRYPGDLIEPEICEDMQRALDGEAVLPNNIKSTDWGEIFITYMPMHSNGEVVGVLGIEFEAEHQYTTYYKLIMCIPIIVLTICSVFTLISMLIFRRISNPMYHDLANTDLLTQLKNRNAFEIDMKNIEAMKQKHGVGILVADLNNLKIINDEFGHGKGDMYIQVAAGILTDVTKKKDLVYRIGGDEYVVIKKDATKEDMEKLIEDIRLRSEEISREGIINVSISMGYAIYDEKTDFGLMDVYYRADTDMYENKRKFRISECK